MKPWDAVLFSVPGSEAPVAPPIRVKLHLDDPEVLWWTTLLAHLWGLRQMYLRLKDKGHAEGQAERTGHIHAKVANASRQLFPLLAEQTKLAAHRAAAERIEAWPWRQADPLPLEVGWWAQAAYCAHALGATYGFSGGREDARAVLAADVLLLVRNRVLVALPPVIADELLELATSTGWQGADGARLSLDSRGTTTTGALPLPETESE